MPKYRLNVHKNVDLKILILWLCKWFRDIVVKWIRVVAQGINFVFIIKESYSRHKA
jgi:hypothetical protein